MIAQAVPTRPHTPPGSPSLVGNKVPMPHRFHLTDGRSLSGDLHRAPGTRLADHLSTLKGFISVTNAFCETTGDTFPHVVLNQDHVVFIEEVHTPAPARVTPPVARTDVPR